MGLQSAQVRPGCSAMISQAPVPLSCAGPVSNLSKHSWSACIACMSSLCFTLLPTKPEEGGRWLHAGR